jgi:hypothetical protein
MPRQSAHTVAVLGIYIGKNTFHLVGLNKRRAKRTIAPNKSLG